MILAVIIAGFITIGVIFGIGTNAPGAKGWFFQVINVMYLLRDKTE